MWFHHIVRWKDLILLKTIFIPGHGVSIVLIVNTNMSCINFLTPTHNLSIDRKSRVFRCAHLKSLLHLIWKVIWHLCRRRIVIPFILFINGTWIIYRRLIITHYIRDIKCWFYLTSHWIESLYSLTQNWSKMSLHCMVLSSSICISNGSNTWTSSSKVVVFILSTMCEIIVTNK